MRKVPLAIVLMTLLMLAVSWLNIPFLREAIVFFYLLFVPGFVLLRIMRIRRLDFTNVVLFSAGLSIAFLMFSGLLFSQLWYVGVSRPLSVYPLSVCIGFSTLVLTFMNWRQDLRQGFDYWAIDWIETKKLVSRAAMLLPLPVLGLVGALFVSSPVLMILILAIAILYVVSLLSSHLLPPKMYPLLIFAISLALLLQVAFSSKYVIGGDSNLEFYVFRLTEISGRWDLLNVNVNPVQTVNYYSMLSITILPTIFSSVLNLSGELVFKTLYPFIFSLVPVTLYQIYKKQIGKKESLFSVFFLISGILAFSGILPLSLNRQIVAVFFLALSIFVVVDDRLSPNKRRVLLVVFGSALVVSHYSVAYIYLAILFLLFVISLVRKDFDRVVNGRIVLLTGTIAFLWYAASVAPIKSLADFFSNFLSGFSNDLLSTAARSKENFLTQPLSNVVNVVSIAVFFLAHLIVALGIIDVLIRPGKIGLHPKYRLIAIFSAVILFLCLALPNVAPSLNLNRFYAITLLVLAPCFLIGFGTLMDVVKSVWSKTFGRNQLVSKFGRKWTFLGSVLVCVLLVSFFLTQSGFLNRVTQNSPLVRPLDFDRIMLSNDSEVQISYYTSYASDHDVFGAVWLQKHQNSQIVFADYLNRNHVLISYGLIPLQQMQPLSNTSIFETDNLVFFGRLNTVNRVIFSNAYDIESFNYSEISSNHKMIDLIYSNGQTEILSVR